MLRLGAGASQAQNVAEDSMGMFSVLEPHAVHFRAESVFTSNLCRSAYPYIISVSVSVFVPYWEEKKVSENSNANKNVDTHLMYLPNPFPPSERRLPRIDVSERSVASPAARGLLARGSLAVLLLCLKEQMNVSEVTLSESYDEGVARAEKEGREREEWRESATGAQRQRDGPTMAMVDEVIVLKLVLRVRQRRRKPRAESEKVGKQKRHCSIGKDISTVPSQAQLVFHPP